MAAPDAATMRKLAAQGKAMKNAKGDPSFPIRGAADLDNAIRAVGRVKPATDAARAKVRRYIMARAKSLGLSSKVPDSWQSDGSLKDDGDSDDSGSSGQSSSGSSGSSSSSSSDDDVAAATKKLTAKGMSPKAARIFATRAAKKKAAA